MPGNSGLASPEVEGPAAWPIVLLPGLGTNAQLFALQRMAFPQVLVPPWLPPERREPLANYGRRMAQSLGLAGPCVLGGASFGGLVALEMTRHLDARACILISSLRGHRELPLWARVAAPAAWLLPHGADRGISVLGSLMLRTLGPVLPQRARDFCVHLSKTRAPLLPWACRAAVSWRVADEWPCPVFQIHGSADPLFPVRWTRPDQVVARGGHLLTLTHPYVVNAFMRDCLAQLLSHP